jgi:hypothetical protein
MKQNWHNSISISINRALLIQFAPLYSYSLENVIWHAHQLMKRKIGSHNGLISMLNDGAGVNHLKKPFAFSCDEMRNQSNVPTSNFRGPNDIKEDHAQSMLDSQI